MRKLQIPTADSLIASVLNLVYPSECPFCGRPPRSRRLSPICPDCFRSIEKYNGPSCRLCAAPLPSEYGRLCGVCLKERPPFSRAICFGLYEDALKEAINRFKFFGAKRLSAPLGELLLRLELPPADCIVPVPLEPHGLRERGFNQTLLLSRVLSKATGIPVKTGVLYKTRRTLPQVGLSRAERAANLKGAFAVRGRLDGKKVILLDDVMTTGATLRECSKALLRAGADEVVGLTLARA